MKCPFCGHTETSVTNSRTTSDGARIRRRRVCDSCEQRFTTYETVDLGPMVVIKADGSREEYNKRKILRGLLRACMKRPVRREQMDQIAQAVERQIANSPNQEIKTEAIGQLILERLRAIDEVSYVRFASVYRKFSDISEFQRELKLLIGGK